MRRDNLAKWTGLPDGVLDEEATFDLYVDLGEGPTKLGSATTVSEAIDELTAQLFPDGPPDYPADAPEFGPGEESVGESDLVRALCYELSEDQLVSRTSSPDELGLHLAQIARDPSLELVVAWESGAPAATVAVAIFRRR